MEKPALKVQLIVDGNKWYVNIDDVVVWLLENKEVGSSKLGFVYDGIIKELLKLKSTDDDQRTEI